MKKTLKKSMSWLLVLATLFSLCAAMSVGVSAATVSLGKAGNDIEAYYDTDTKTLSLIGSGPMTNYVSDGELGLYTNMNPRPWDSYIGQIKTVVMDSRITSIGNAAFYNLTMLTSVSLPSSVQTIGEWAFARTGLTSIIIPATTQTVKHFAFYASALNSDGANSICLGPTVILNEHITSVSNGVVTGAGQTTNQELVKDLNRAASGSVVINASGTVPAGIQWTYSTNTKVLKLFYEGDGVATMSDLSAARPWEDYMTEIQAVEIGPNIANIGAYAFVGAGNLRSVDLSRATALSKIGVRAFAGCGSLTSLTLPQATLTIEAEAFSSRYNNITITTPNAKVTMDPGNACANDYYIVWNYGTIVNTPSGGTSTPTGQNGTLSGGVTWVYTNGVLVLTAAQANSAIPGYTAAAQTPWALAGLSNSIHTVIIGQNITSVGSYAFANMTSLSNVTLGTDVSVISASAFAGTTGLRTINFPAGVVYVDANAFTGSGLISAVQQNSGMIIADPNVELKAALNGTGGSGSTSNQTVGGAIPNSTLSWSYNSTTKALTISGTGAMPGYASSLSTPWGAAGYNNQITSVVIGAGVTSVGSYAFSGMSALTSISLGENVAGIGQYAFAYNTGITSIVLPASVTLVDSFAFYGASSLRTASRGNASMTINDPNNELKTALGQQNTTTNPSGTIAGTALAWSYATATGALTISGTGNIPDYNSYVQTPWGQQGLTASVKTVYIGSAVTRIGNYAFAGMTNLTAVGIGSSVQSIGQYAFGYDSALTSVSLPASVTLVESNAFTGCSVLAAAEKKNASTVINVPNVELNNALNNLSGGNGGNGSTVAPPTSGQDNSGLFGPNNSLIWDYSAKKNRLMISAASGKTGISMPDYSSSNQTPWASLKNSITTIIIGYDIVNIGNYAFADMPYLQSVYMGESITSVGYRAFYNDLRLGSIEFPASVATVQADAFTGCSALYTATKKNAAMVVNTPNTELLRVLGTSSTNPNPNPNPNPGTSGSTVVQSITGTNLLWTYDQTTGSLNITGSGSIPNYTATAPAPWNAYSTTIKAITVQTGVTGIGSRAFAGITNVVDLYLPDTVTTIGNEAFYGCVALRTVRLPATLQTLGAGAFRACASLAAVEIPDTIKVIADYTFRDCTSLESIKLSSTLNQIGIEAFAGCIKLNKVEFPTTLYSVGARAFSGATTLETVVFRANNTTVSLNAFEGCTGLKKAVYEVNPPATETGNDLLVKKFIARYSSGEGWMADRANGTLTISGVGEVTSSAAWKSELQFVDTLIFSNGITGIGAGLLKDDRNVTHVQMADSVTTIGANAFEGCTHLQTVDFSDALHTVGAGAFAGCSSLTSIELPDSLKVIPENAFARCSTLQNVDMGSGLMMIGAGAFANCTLLDDVVLPASLRSIAAGAFNDCYSLTKLELYGGSLNALAADTFDNCNRLSVVGFHGTKTEWDALTANADAELKSAVVTYYVKLTVHHVYKGGPKDGQTVATSDVLSGKKGDVVTVTAKTDVANYQADAFTATFTLGEDNSELTITYSPKTYTLKIECVDAKTGTLLGTLPDQQVKYGDSFKATAGAIEGYTAEDSTINVESMSGDMTYTVKYNKNVYTYTVEYFNTQTNKVFDTKEYQAEHGSAITAETPELTGYTLVSGSYKIDKLTKDGEKITVKYEPSQKMLTIEYVDTEGNKLSEDVTVSLYYGAEVMIASPAITGKVADQPIVQMEAYNGEDKITVTYDWRYYTVTIQFLEKDSYGYKIRPDYIKSVKHGDPFTFAMDNSYNEPAYVTDKSAVTYAAVTADITETVTYSPKPLTLTIEYVKVDGKKIGTVEQTVYAGKSYTVEPHEFKKYLQTEEPVTGTMGIENATITITLEKDPSAGSVGRVLLVIFIILLVLGTGGALFYFLYLKKKPY